MGQTVTEQTVMRQRAMGNLLLASLAADVQERLNSLCSRVTLQKSTVLVEAGLQQTHAYFPIDGLLSLQTMTPDGGSVEVAMVGREGIAALPFTVGAAAGCTLIVSVPGDAMSLGVEALQKECDRSPALQRALIQRWNTMIGEIAHGSACHRFHTARQRLARWLLAASDRVQSSRLELTQEQLGDILGLRRTVVTAANIELQNAGAIVSRHGCIRILDRARLQKSACGC